MARQVKARPEGNRIMAAITAMEENIKDRIAQGLTTQAKVEAMDLDMDLVEFAKFQELKTLAFAHGLLSKDEANTIFAILGETPSVFNSRSPASKVVLTRIFAELMTKRVQGRL